MSRMETINKYLSRHWIADAEDFAPSITVQQNTYYSAFCSCHDTSTTPVITQIRPEVSRIWLNNERTKQAGSRQLTLIVLESVPRRGMFCLYFGSAVAAYPHRVTLWCDFTFLMAWISRQIMMYLAPLEPDKPHSIPDPTLVSDVISLPHPLLCAKWQLPIRTGVHFTTIRTSNSFPILRFSNFCFSAASFPDRTCPDCSSSSSWEAAKLIENLNAMSRSNCCPSETWCCATL